MIPEMGQGRIHLLGICGTAMASLAGLLSERGFTITGSDENVYPPMSGLLADLGIPVRSPYGAGNVPEGVDLVVVGNAISRGNPELEAILDRRLSYASMPEVVKAIFLRGKTPVVVAGTHGKTTTTSLVAWILESAGLQPGYLVGGIPLNFERSYREGKGDVFVIEGDEYDTAYFDKGPKFLHYLPQIAVVGNVEFDHADIYADAEAVETAFRRLVNLIPRRGLLVVGEESPGAVRVAAGALCPVETFGVEGRGFWQARAREWGGTFEVSRDGAAWGDYRGPFWGNASLRNAIAAVAVAARLGLSRDAIAQGLVSFRGVKRRMDVRGEKRGVTVVDDFAHHPTAIRETIRAARLRFPGRRLWAVFEPRSFTVRTRVFQDELADALAGADAVVLAAVFTSHRISPEDELSEEELVGSLTRRGVPARFVPDVPAIVSLLAKELEEGDLVLAMSNGGFGGLHDRLLAAL